MPCKKYHDLQIGFDGARQQWAQFTYEQNRHLRGGISDSRAKQVAREAKDEWVRISREMSDHRLNCEECKLEAVKSPSDSTDNA